MRTIFQAILIPSILLLSEPLIAHGKEPTRIIIECEEMQGVDQDHFGPGAGWRVGRWGHDVYQNMTFGGGWTSRLRTAMTDAGDNRAEITADIAVPADGVYKVWVKYECPPYFNYAFGLKLESLDAKGAAVFDKTYGLRESPKHFSFRDKPLKGDLYCNYGIDHDAAEGYEAALVKGRCRVTLYKTKNVAPAGARSIDAIMITSDLSAVSSPKMSWYPLLDELRRGNHVYFRFRNPATAAAPVRITWDHWNHRYPDFCGTAYRELVKFYDAQGRLLAGGKNGDWPAAIAPGAASPWHDLGPTMNTESTSPYSIQARPDGAKPDDPSAPFAVDIALEPRADRIVKSFQLDKGEPSLTFLVQPDLNRPEGVAATKKLRDIYAELTRDLDAEPRLGALPKRLRLFGQTGSINLAGFDLEPMMRFREALGLNTIYNPNLKEVPAVQRWAKQHGGIVDRSIVYLHSQDPQQIVKWVKDNGLEKQFYFLSYGDEIGLPPTDVKDAGKVAAFRDYLQAQGETPQSLGFSRWDEVKPLAALSADVAVQIGVLPQGKQSGAVVTDSLKRLYWHSQKFRAAQGIASLAEKTAQIKAALGSEVQTSANLGGMVPFYWMPQSSFIESFKRGAMSLAWSEDYTYCSPEASRLVADFETAYLRKGASYHDTPMQFYCMPHWPGNTPEELVQNAVMEWGQNVKDLDFFCLGFDAWLTENYVAYRGGLPTFKAVRTISGMAGLLEEHLLPARTEPARVALVLSDASDVWEVQGKDQGAVEPGSMATNVSQEERKAIWYVLRNAGYRVDVVTEADCAEGLLQKYSAIYLCGENLDRKAARAIKERVLAGAALFATAGAARKDEFDLPSAELDETLGRGRAIRSQRYRGPLRSRLELPFEKPLDRIKLVDGKTMPVLCSREEFAAGQGVRALGSYANGNPAFIAKDFGKGRAYYIGALPGQAYLKAGMPVAPEGKGGAQTSPWLIESLSWDPVAADVVLQAVKAANLRPDVVANHRGIVTNRLKSDKSTVITVVNLAQQADGNLKDVELRISGLKAARRAWSCFHSQGLPLRSEGDGAIVVRLPTLAAADVVVVEP